MKNGILVTADMHLRDDTPVCCGEEFQKAQWDRVHSIMNMVHDQNLYWVDCGDIFHKCRPSYKLVNRFIDTARAYDVHIDAAICGNHDMPAHNMGSLDDSAFGTLCASKTIKQFLFGHSVALELTNGYTYNVYGANYTEKPYAPTDIPDPRYKRNILLMHDMVFSGRKDKIPGVEGVYAEKLLKEWGEHYEFIFSGHNHKAFSRDDRFFNVGCLTRQSADMADHIVSVCIINCGGIVRRHTLPHTGDAVSRKHLEEQQAHEEQIVSFVESLGNNEEVSLSFQGNVQIVLNKVKPSNTVKSKVQEAME